MLLAIIEMNDGSSESVFAAIYILFCPSYIRQLPQHFNLSVCKRKSTNEGR